MYDPKLIPPDQRLEAQAYYRDLRRFKQQQRVIDNPLPPSSNVGQVVRSTNGTYGSVGGGRRVVGYRVLMPCGWVDGDRLERAMATLPWPARYLLTRARTAGRNARSGLPPRLIVNSGGFGSRDGLEIPLALACLALRDRLEER